MRGVHTRTLLVACALTWGLGTRTASAEQSQVSLELRECPSVDANEVQRVVRTELGTTLSALGQTRIVARCQGRQVSIEVSISESRTPLGRSFALAEGGDAGVSRLIGIAAAELILTRPSDGEIRESSPLSEAVEPRARTASSKQTDFDDDEQLGSPRGRRHEHDTHLRLLALASRRALFAYGGALWGGSLRLEAEPLEHLSWATDLSFEQGEFTAARQPYALKTWTLGAHLFFVQELSPFLLRAGGGLRAGFASSTPVGNEEQDTGVLASWGWPLVTLNLSVRLGSRLVLELASEASYVVLPVSARGRTLRGVWLGNQLGLGFVF